MAFVITLALTFVIVLITLLVFVRCVPVYRLERQNLVTLLQMVVDGHASELDWDVFVGVPIRHNSELAEVQRRCIRIADKEYRGGKGRLFSPAGMRQIAELLDELKSLDDTSRDTRGQRPSGRRVARTTKGNQNGE